jgi:hypothetical protein
MHMTVRKFNLIDISQKHGVRKAKDQDSIPILKFNYLTKKNTIDQCTNRLIQSIIWFGIFESIHFVH